MNEEQKKIKPKDYTPKTTEEKVRLDRFDEGLADARRYFLSYTKPRLDKWYKLYRSYTGDRAAKIQDWQSNVFIPYIFSVVETLVPRVIGSKPDFLVFAREENDIPNARKIQQIFDYLWEKARMETKVIDWVKLAMINGYAIGKTFYRKEYKIDTFIKDIDLQTNAKKYAKKANLVYDDPDFEPVSNYDFWRRPSATSIKDMGVCYQRYILNREEIVKQYPNATNLEYIVEGFNQGDITDYKQVMKDVLTEPVKGKQGKANNDSDLGKNTNGAYVDTNSSEKFEVIEQWTDTWLIVKVGGHGGVPIIDGPNPYKEGMPFQLIRFVTLPHEFEGIGLCEILQNPQELLNVIKNQRIDNVTLGIHKMWIVNPLANINQRELTARPYGIIYSTDPNGVKAVESGDIKQSAYIEEEKLKEDMRNATGVDDYSRGVSDTASSATAASYLRESTLERVKLFLRILENDGFVEIMRQWFKLTQLLYTKEKVIRINGTDGSFDFVKLSKDDLRGEYDFKAGPNSTVVASLELKKKQDMELYNLLVDTATQPEPDGSGPIISKRKLVVKVLQDWQWDPESVLENEMPKQPVMEEPTTTLPPIDQPPTGVVEQQIPGMPTAGVPGMSPEGMPPQGVPTAPTAPTAPTNGVAEAPQSRVPGIANLLNKANSLQ